MKHIGIAALLLVGSACSKDVEVDVEKMISRTAAFRDRMCACTDAACTEQVTNEMLRWSSQQSAQRAPEMTTDQTTRSAAIAEAMGKCMERVAQPPPPTTHDFESKTGRYSIEFPAKPTEEAQGGVVMVSSALGRHGTCGIGHVDASALGSPEQFFENASANVRSGATVVEDKPTEIRGYPGRSLIIQTASQRKWWRGYVVGGTGYLLICGTSADRATADEPIAKKFLDSFSVATPPSVERCGEAMVDILDRLNKAVASARRDCARVGEGVAAFQRDIARETDACGALTGADTADLEKRFGRRLERLGTKVRARILACKDNPDVAAYLQ